MAEAHPTSLKLSQHLGGLLDAAEDGEVRAHLAQCVLCRAERSVLEEMNLAATVREGPGHGLEDTLVRERAPSAPPPEGEIITGFEVSRYVVTRRLGQGAMGQVFAAYDPRLDRNVAIKLLRADLPMVENKPLRQRLEREAQALARLSHPNVVAVHDLGEHGDQLFIAMDLVEGQTLTEWLQGPPRPWTEVQRVFLMAAEGLAAAHRAGLVHRDFKPDNVLVGADGVVRVSDFGVSRRIAKDTTGGGDDTITGAGSLIGTPAFMSPEQFDGKPADHRSDQFSFCVALFLALSGQLPFAGKTLREQADAVHAGPPERIPSPATLPPWLERLVLKGLATSPAARFGSMDELIGELRGPAPKKKPPLAPLAIAAAAVLVASVLGGMEYVRRRDDPCFHVDERVARAWDEEAHGRLKQAFAATKVPWAADSSARVDKEFHRFLSRWAGDYAQTCASPAGSQRAARQACLENQLRSFEFARSVLEKPNANLLREGLTNLPSTLSSTDCGVNAWYAEVPSEPARRQRLEELQERLISLEVASALKSGEQRLEAAVQLQRDATTHGFPQIAAAAALTRGLIVWHQMNGREALPLVEEAAIMADGARHDLVAADARRSKVEILVAEFDVKLAREAVPAMRAAFQRLGRDPDASRQVLDVEASILVREGKFAEAVERRTKALALLQPWEEPSRCALLAGLALALERGGSSDEGLARNEDAVKCLRETLGSDHPAYATALNTRAGFLSRANREEEAETFVLAALALLEKDPDQRAYTTSLYNHGLVLKRRKLLERALPEIERAVALAEARHDESMLAQMLGGLAETLQELGQLERAETSSARAVELARRVYGENSNQLASTLTARGSILASLGRHEEAAAQLRQAIGIFEAVGGSPVLLEVTRYELGCALWQSKATRAEAVAMVRKVRDGFAARGPNFKDYTDEAQAWLRTHPPK